MAKISFFNVCFPIVVFCFGIVFCSNIPEYIHICHRNDKQISKCITNSIEALRPKLPSGIPELGVPGLDPFHLKRIVIFDGNGNNGLHAYLENINVYGASKFEITKLKLDLDKMTYRVGLRLPYLDIQGDIDINARILVAPLNGRGKFYANTTNVVGQAVIQAGLKENVMFFESIALRLEIGDFNLKLENLFNGDPVLGEAANQLLNTNKEELMNMALPFIESKASEIFLDLANKITQNFSYDEIFPL